MLCVTVAVACLVVGSTVLCVTVALVCLVVGSAVLCVAAVAEPVIEIEYIVKSVVAIRVHSAYTL